MAIACSCADGEELTMPDATRSLPGDDATAVLTALQHEARGCQRCPLWEIGTQTVFGVGPADARLMFVGEAPGQQEDERGEPFVGPSGQLLDEALAAAGLRRADVYITNVVKHRPSVPAGKRRKNRPPKRSEITACAPAWLARELAVVQPQIVCCLGAVAAKELLGQDFRLTQRRGEWFSSVAAPHVLPTVHPSFVLIQPAESAARWRATFRADVQQVADRLRELS
jgi:DNA polymerase